MSKDHHSELYELAALIHDVSRRLPAPGNLEPGPCTPIEINIMRIVARDPGLSARAAAQACGLPSSNFSRVLKGLVAKGLLERRADERDARVAHLYPTDLAAKNRDLMRDAWGAAMEGAGLDHETIICATKALRRLDTHLSGEPVDREKQERRADNDR